METQLAQIYQLAHKDNILMVEQMPVQQQQNGKDCRLFAIAYAFHAALGDDVTIMHFDISKMGQHLIYCLDREELSPFPMEEDKPLETCDRSRFYISLHCTCLLPKDTWQDGRVLRL